MLDEFFHCRSRSPLDNRLVAGLLYRRLQLCEKFELINFPGEAIDQRQCHDRAPSSFEKEKTRTKAAH
jgi:hypothetical protein